MITMEIKWYLLSQEQIFEKLHTSKKYVNSFTEEK
jgi:hypothetical protein